MRGDGDDQYRTNKKAGLLLLLLLIFVVAGYVLFYRLTQRAEELGLFDAARETVQLSPPDESVTQNTDEDQLVESPAIVAGSFDGTLLQISPNGEWIAFLRGERLRKDIWIAPFGNLSAARPLGLVEAQGIVEFRWAYNNTHILYRRAFDILTQIYAVDISNGQVLALNPFEQTAIGNVSLSPWHPDEMLVQIGSLSEMSQDLYRANILTGEIEFKEATDVIQEYFADQDFIVRAGRTTSTRGFTIFARREEGWEDVLFVARDLGERTGALFLGAGHDLIYILDDEGRDTIALSSIDLATGGRFVIAEHAEGNVTRVLTNPATSEIVAYRVEERSSRWYALDRELGPDIDRLNERFPEGGDVVSQTLDNQVWLLHQGQDYFTFDRGDGLFRLLSE